MRSWDSCSPTAQKYLQEQRGFCWRPMMPNAWERSWTGPNGLGRAPGRISRTSWVPRRSALRTRVPTLPSSRRASLPPHCLRPCQRTSAHPKRWPSRVDLLSAALANTPKTHPNPASTSPTTKRLLPPGTTNSRSATLWKNARTRTISFPSSNGPTIRKGMPSVAQAIIQSYVDAVKEARRSGARLLHAHFTAQDFDIVLDLYPEAPDRWLEGMDSTSAEFRRRVRLAEGFFVALCEAVLRRNPSRGIPLWRALRRCVATQFISRTGIDRLKYAPFAAIDCPAVDAILGELYGLDESRTDEDLFDIVVAARSSDRADWLDRVVSRDENSPCPAHRRRAAFLRPLLNRPGIAGDAAWPSGESPGGYDAISVNSWIMAQRESFATHWLRSFAEAVTPESAHAAWLLYMACCDRRAKTWMSEDYGRYAVRNGSIAALKLRFISQHRYRFDRAITDNEKSLGDRFTAQRIADALLPWNVR